MFRGSDLESMKVDSLMVGAKIAFDEIIKGQGLNERDIAWYRADIEKYPETDIMGAGIANQIVISPQRSLTRSLSFKSTKYTPQEDQQLIGKQIKHLTGEFFDHISCG